MIALNTNVIIVTDPTAASASEPTYLPKIKTSVMLYNCCNIFPAANGIIKRIRFLLILPFVMSIIFPLRLSKHTFRS